LDLAVAWGRGDWPGLVSELLVPTRIIAVCSPALIKDGPPLREFADLRNHTLLQEIDHGLWRDWLAAVGADDVTPRSSVTMDDPNVVHQAAVEGQGVALGAAALLDDEISQGRLVQLFDRSVDLGGAYYLVHPPSARNRPNVKAFCEWLSVEARTTGSRSSGAKRGKSRKARPVMSRRRKA
ncbi:MAG: LysR substrate-binding domain-containing protein, partial [Alphaproteobacteria bacterium]